MDLVARIKYFAKNPKQRTSMVRKFPGVIPAGALPPPVTASAVRTAERRLGFRLPPLLGRLWVEIGNGGFGPGYGLSGLGKGGTRDAMSMLLPAAYLALREDPACEEFLGEPWPERLVPVCEWGCGHQSAIDCSTEEGQVVDLNDQLERRPRGVTFERWMEEWVDGVDLWTP